MLSSLTLSCIFVVLVVSASDLGLRDQLKSLIDDRNSLNAKINSIVNLLDDEECSGNGFYYDDINGCECFSCFSGSDCGTFDSACVLTDTGGNPLLFEYYWRNHTDTLANEDVPAYYRSPYQFSNTIQYQYISSDYNATNPYQGQLIPLLADKIVELHTIIGNIKNIDKKNIVIGQGGTELINALSYACKELYSNGNTMYVYARPPYYNGYPNAYIHLDAKNIEFSSSSALDPSTVIEYVTYPNNPTNDAREPEYQNKAACTIYDDVYFWPSLFDNITELDTSVSIFSMSKLSGHAGTRLGWALVDDMDIVNKMQEFLDTVQIAVAIDSQYRTYNILNAFTQNNGEMAYDFFNWVKQQLSSRWDTINTIFDPNAQNRFIQYAKPGGFYCWIECQLEVEKDDCFSVFQSVGIEPESGVSFGGDMSYVRLELVVADPVWQIMVTRLEQLVA